MCICYTSTRKELQYFINEKKKKFIIKEGNYSVVLNTLKKKLLN